MPPRLKLGLVGAGPVATRYCVPAIRAVPEVVAYLVADVDGDRAQTVAQTCPFVHWTKDYQELCSQVDLAVVALPNHLHQPVACRLLEAGVHVLCVKPMRAMLTNAGTCLAARTLVGQSSAWVTIGGSARISYKPRIC